MAELRHEPPPRSPLVVRLAIVLVAVGLFGCDHATKIAAQASLSGGRSVPLVDGVLELRYIVNSDTAFGVLRFFGVAWPPVALVALASVALAGIVGAWLVQRRRATLLQHLGFAVVLAAALGNVLDRAFRGYVVDFIHVTRWPVFNVADIAVVAGAILLTLGASRPKTPDDPADRPGILGGSESPTTVGANPHTDEIAGPRGGAGIEGEEPVAPS